MHKLLLVDDDTTLTRFLSEFLQGDGFETIIANNGQDALMGSDRSPA